MTGTDSTEGAITLPPGRTVAIPDRTCAVMLPGTERALELAGAMHPAARHAFRSLDLVGRAFQASDAGRFRPMAVGDDAVSLHDPIDVHEAARILEVSDRQVRRLCRDGRFASARELGSSWLVERTEVVARAVDRTVARDDHRGADRAG